MYRSLLASTAIVALAAPALAEDISTDLTQPVRTSTANDGAPAAITITDTGSVTVTSGTAVTMDSDHAVTNEGEIAASNADGTMGIAALAGTSGAIVNEGEIIAGESYTATDTDNDGDLDGPFALGSGRYGIRTLGAHSGDVVNAGTIDVEGNDSFGIRLEGPQQGKLTHDGTTTVLGDRSTAVSAQAIDGDVRLAGTVRARGEDSVGAHFGGDIDGALVVQGTVAATGYRNTTAPSNTAALDADDLLQGGSALVIEGDVSGGILLAVAPGNADPDDDDEDDDGRPDADEGSASVTSYGEAPAFIIGADDRDIAVGAVDASGSGFGLIVDGQVSGQGVYAGVDGNGLVIGGRGGGVTIANGIGIAGAVTATSRDAGATALRLGAGAEVPLLQVSGQVSATTGDATGATSIAVQVDAGADLPVLRNSGTIRAVAGDKGSATAILDVSGGLALIENSGTIRASGADEDSDRNIAIDLRANTAGATVRQTQVGAGFTAPSISGDVLFGSGDDTFALADGTATGATRFGAGNNTLQLSGDAVQTGTVQFGAGNDAMSLAGTSRFNGTADFGGGNDTLAIGGSAYFAGGLVNAGGLAVSLEGGVLDIGQAATIGSLAVSADSALVVTLDQDAGQGTALTVSGIASFEEDAVLAVRLADIHEAEGRYTVLEAGELQGVDGIDTDTGLIPFLFKATISEDAAANQIAIDIARKSAGELELNRSQAAAYDAILAATGNDEDIEAVFLGITDGDEFRGTVDLMLPDHAGGAFQGVSQGVRAFARQVAEPIGPVFGTGGINIILNAAAWGADKDRGETAAYNLEGLGISAGGEIETDLGNFGLTASWIWNDYTSGGSLNRVLSNTYELAAHWRGEWDRLKAFGRAAVGLSSFEGRRTFIGDAGDEALNLDVRRDWNGTVTSLIGGIAYEGGGRHLFFRPSVTVDYVKLDEDGYTDTGGGAALDLTVEDRSSDELAVNGGMTLGVDFIGTGRTDANWFRVETEGGWREIVGGSLGSTTAYFEGGDAFTLDPEQPESGWYAALRAVGGSSGFTLGGELGAEDRLDTIAYTVRGSLRLKF